MEIVQRLVKPCWGGFTWVTKLNTLGRIKSSFLHAKIVREHPNQEANSDLEYMINAFPRFPFKIICVVLMQLRESCVLSSALTSADNFPWYAAIRA